MLSISDTDRRIVSLEVVDIIVPRTNKKAETVYEEYNSKHPENESHVWKKVTRQEIYAFFAISICAGANNSNIDHVNDMWKKASKKQLYGLYDLMII